MRETDFVRKDAAVLLLIAAVAVWRVFSAGVWPVDALANFTPLGAMALFGGACLDRVRGFAFPLLAIWLSDIFLNRMTGGQWVLFYGGALWTYSAFALMVIVGRLVRPDAGVGRFVGSSLLIVFIHWIVTDTEVWLNSGMYPRTAAGYWACLVAAIPFERNFLAGTLLYGGVLFGGLAYLQHKTPALRTAQK